MRVHTCGVLGYVFTHGGCVYKVDVRPRRLHALARVLWISTSPLDLVLSLGGFGLVWGLLSLELFLDSLSL